jgi:hypothetical protein
LINLPSAPSEGQIFTSGASSWVYSSGRWLAAPEAQSKYVIGCFVPGLMTAAQVLLVHRLSKAVTLPANFGSYSGYASQASGTAAATASTVVTASRALAASPTTFSNVGTITIAAGGVVPTFATSGAVAFAQGDLLRLSGPATADTTFAGFACTIVTQEV